MTNNQTDWRALCAELHAALEKHDVTWEEENLLDQSAAALRRAQPEPHASIDAANRVAHYLEQRRLIRGLDQDVINALHAGTDEPRQATLTVADLQTLVCAYLAQPEPKGATDEEIEREAIANADTDDEYRAFKNGAFFVQEHMNRLALARWGK